MCVQAPTCVCPALVGEQDGRGEEKVELEMSDEFF